MTRIHLIVFLKLAFGGSSRPKCVLVRNQNFYFLKCKLQPVCIETLLLLCLAFSFASAKPQDQLFPPLACLFRPLCVFIPTVKISWICVTPECFLSVSFKTSQSLVDLQEIRIEQLKFIWQMLQRNYPLWQEASKRTSERWQVMSWFCAWVRLRTTCCFTKCKDKGL